MKNSVCISVKIVLEIFGIYLDFSWTWKDRDTDCLLYDETLQIHSSRVYWLAEVGSCGIVSSREAWKVWWGLSGTLKYCTLNSLFVCSSV